MILGVTITFGKVLFWISSALVGWFGGTIHSDWLVRRRAYRYHVRTAVTSAKLRAQSRFARSFYT